MLGQKLVKKFRWFFGKLKTPQFYLKFLDLKAKFKSTWFCQIFVVFQNYMNFNTNLIGGKFVKFRCHWISNAIKKIKVLAPLCLSPVGSCYRACQAWKWFQNWPESCSFVVLLGYFHDTSISVYVMNLRMKVTLLFFINMMVNYDKKIPS